MFYLPVMSSMPQQGCGHQGESPCCTPYINVNQVCPYLMNGGYSKNCQCHSESGDDGKTIELPTIGDNGNWFIGGVDTGISAKGEPGPQGPKGEQGLQGPAGTSGKDCECNILTEDIEKTIEITDLQSEIDALPKLLMANVIFHVNPGTCGDVITINDFAGSGRITINGASAANQTTHNILRMSIATCSIPCVYINGFNATATSGLCFQTVKADVEFKNCNATAGTAIGGTSGSNGVSVREAFALIQGCVFSNHYYGIRVYSGRALVTDASGSGNKVAYSAEVGGLIQKRNAGTLTGTSTNEVGQGGLIIGPNGASI